MKNLLQSAVWRKVAAPISRTSARVAQEWLKYAAVFVMLFTLGIGNVWGTDPVDSQTPGNGTFVVVVYDATAQKYYALPNATTNGGTLAGVEVSVNSSGQVTTTNPPTWTLTKGTGDNANYYHLTYTSGSNTYKLYKNGTGKSNYNFKVSTGDVTYWSFSGSTSAGYTVVAEDRGTTNNVNIQCNSGTFRCYSSASAVRLLTVAPSGYTVDFAVNTAGYGSVSPSAQLTGVSSGTAITKGTGANVNKVTVGSTTVTATPTAQTAQYTYEFSSWSVTDNLTSVTKNVTITANFTRTTRSYGVTTNFTNIAVKSGSTAFPATLAYGGSFSTTLAASSGYVLPASVAVTGATLDSWNSSTGAISISSVTGAVTITASGVQGSTWKFKYSGDSWTEHTMTESAGVASYSISLAADSRFEFGIDDNGTFYKNQGTIITTTEGWVFNTSDNNCKIHTGPAGTYIFAINTTTKAVTVTYPEVTHPNEHYVYFKNTSVWGTVKGYLGNTNNDNKAAAWPGSDMQATTTICNETYHYAALNAMNGTYNVIIFNNGSGAQTSDLSTTGSLGKYNANQDAAWHDFKYSISFAGNGNTSGSMTDIENLCPGSNQQISANAFVKSGYNFSGWIASTDVTINNATVTQGTLITGTPTIQNIQGNITLTAQWVKIPSITRNPSALAFGSRKVDGSYDLTFTVSASDLYSTNGLTLAVMGSNTGMYDIDKTSIAQTSTGTISSTTVTVTYHPTAAGSHADADVRITTPNGVGGTVTVSVTLSGTGIYAHSYIDNIWGTVIADQTAAYTRPTIADKDPGALTDCQHLHYHFVGWITKTKYDAGSTIDARTTPTGDIQTTGSVAAPSSNETFYAVWEKEASGSGGANVYTLVEETLSDWSGSYIFTDPDKGHAMSNSLSSGKFGSKTVTPSNNQITSTDGDIIWVVTKGTGDNASKYSVYNASVNKYANNGTSSTSASLSDNAVYLTFTRDETYGDVAIKGANGRWFSYYSDNEDFRTYNRSSDYGVYLYRNSVSYEDPIASCGAEYTITIDKNNASATCTSCGAKVTANATALSNLVAPTWAGHQVEYYMVASAENSTKIAEADGTLASGVTVSGTPWTDANGKWVLADGATFYVKWKTTQCVITLNNQGATTAGTASVTATYGASTNLTTSLEIPAKNGYDFGGYFTETNGAGTQLVDANGAWLASKTGYTNASKQWQLDATSLELFAKWTIKSYTVTWVVNGTTEATQASVSYGTLYSNLTEEPTVAHNAIKDACGSDRFVGWVSQEYTGEGGTAGSQFEPYKATASTQIDDDHHTFYAMFATENGTAFTLDGTVGSTQEVYVYYTDGTNNYYATGNIGASSTGKINSTTNVADANTYVFTKTGTGTYTIQKKNDANYINYVSSTDLGTQAAAYTWTISDVSSAGLGSWRLQSGTNQRAWICRTDGTPKFGGYSTTGVTVSQTYRDVELGSSNLTDYRTGCCDEKITLTVSDATSGVGGTVAMKWNNADKSSGDQVSTCSAGTLVAKITANPGYSLTAVTISGTSKSITTDPANLATGLPSTSEMTYTVSVQALATGTLTITPTFSRMYTVTYNLDGGETSGSTTTASYLPNTTVNFVTPNPTRSGYNFDGWVVNKEGGGTQSATSTNFSMPSDNVTVVAQWSAKPLSSITVTPTTATVYVGQYVELPVTYDPADILTKGYTLVSTPSWCVTTGSTQTTLKITGGRSGATINEDKTETVSIQANADNTKTASVTVTVKPLPVDHFVDLIHNVSFDDKGASIVNNILQATYSAPGYATDYSGATAAGCETEHLHLIGWIDSEWADANPKATQSQITSAPGYHVAYEAGMTANNKTYYAVWGHEVVEP